MITASQALLFIAAQRAVDAHQPDFDLHCARAEPADTAGLARYRDNDRNRPAASAARRSAMWRILRLRPTSTHNRRQAAPAWTRGAGFGGNRAIHQRISGVAKLCGLVNDETAYFAGPAQLSRGVDDFHTQHASPPSRDTAHSPDPAAHDVAELLKTRLYIRDRHAPLFAARGAQIRASPVSPMVRIDTQSRRAIVAVRKSMQATPRDWSDK